MMTWQWTTAVRLSCCCEFFKPLLIHMCTLLPSLHLTHDHPLNMYQYEWPLLEMSGPNEHVMGQSVQ